MDSAANYKASLANLKPEVKEYFLKLAQDPSISHIKIAKLMNKQGYLTGRSTAFDFRAVSFIALHFGLRRKTGGPKRPFTKNKVSKSLQLELNYKQEVKNERSALINLIMEAKTISKTERVKAIEALME